MLEHLHEFKEVRTVEYQPAGWYPADEPTTPSRENTQPAVPKKRRPARKRRRGKHTGGE